MTKFIEKIRWPGRRGIFLLFFGLLYMTTGQGWIYAPPTPTAAVNLYVIVAILPLAFWGWVWVATGLLMLAAAAWRRLEVWAFGAAAALATFWGLGYLAAAPPLGHGTGRAYVAMFTYYGFAFIFQVIAGWPEPIKIPKPPPIQLPPDLTAGHIDD